MQNEITISPNANALWQALHQKPECNVTGKMCHAAKELAALGWVNILPKPAGNGRGYLKIAIA